MKFQPGHKMSKGRPAGSLNKTTKTAREAFQLAFDQLGGYEGLVNWALESQANKTAFYNLYGRLIPVEVAGSPDAPLEVTITRRVIADRS